MKRITKNSLWKILAALPAMVAAYAGAAFAQEGAAQDVIGLAKNWQLGFQPAASPTKERMEWFHNALLLPTITVITIFVIGLLIYVLLRFRQRANPVPSKTTHNTMLEVVWTLVPVIILVIIVIPSMKMLYFIDRTHNAEMTLKVTGFQWYWGYEYPDHGGVNFLSNMVPDKEIKEGQQRLLSTDNVVVLPVDTNIRLLVTASDVLHSWAVPSFGIKIDAVPGRTNETWVRIEREGVYYGQCSELCGTNHGFMPIEVHAVSKEKYADWVIAQGGKMPEEPVNPATVPAAVSGSDVDAAAEEPRKAADEMDAKDIEAQESAKEEGGAVTEATKEIIDELPPQKAGEEAGE